jgi:hypothetical protein
MCAALLMGCVSGCGASTSAGTPPSTVAAAPATASGDVAQAPVASATSRPQKPGTCEIAPPRVQLPTGEWTATTTILSTNAIDACEGEQAVRPWDFRRRCAARRCTTYLFTASYYGIEVAKVVRIGHGRFLAVFRPTTVPCPHRPGEDAGSNKGYKTITFSFEPHSGTIRGLGRERQRGPCGGGPAGIKRYVVERTDPAANPPAPGP